MMTLLSGRTDAGVGIQGRSMLRVPLPSALISRNRAREETARTSVTVALIPLNPTAPARAYRHVIHTDQVRVNLQEPP
jgi:hypothetical protein